jgi:hypothetical protein
MGPAGPDLFTLFQDRVELDDTSNLRQFSHDLTKGWQSYGPSELGVHLGGKRGGTPKCASHARWLQGVQCCPNLVSMSNLTGSTALGQPALPLARLGWAQALSLELPKWG